MPLLPLVGPDANTPEWHEARKSSIGASESAAAAGVSEERQPFDVYLEKTGQVPPFEGNEFTGRGLRFQPFIGQEYEIQTGHDLEQWLPMYRSPEHAFVSATPDARLITDPAHLVELKACNWRRARLLGEEGTDEVFPDWNVQAQHQMYVMGADVCDLFVMVDLHTYRSFTVRRNEDMIRELVENLCDLWDRIERRDPPPINAKHPKAEELVKRLYAVETGKSIELSAAVEGWWEEQHRLKDEIEALEQQRKELRTECLAAMGDAAIGVLPSGLRVLTRTQVAATSYTVEKKAYVMLRERKVAK